MSRDQKPGKARVFASGTMGRERRAEDLASPAAEPVAEASESGGGSGWATAVLFLLACASGGAGLAAARVWGVA